MYVLPGDLIHLKREVMEVINEQECDPEPDAKLETVVKAVVIHDGDEACTLGFLPCHVACQPQEAAHLHRKFSQILELYADDPEDCVRVNKSRRNHGVASFCCWMIFQRSF
jgi:hypothetical protein